MTNIELSPPQTEMLIDILEGYLGDLRMEISSTDQMDFRERLKEREVFVKDLIQRLRRGKQPRTQG